MFIEQDYESYTEEDHYVWNKLYTRQTENLVYKTVPEFWSGISLLEIDEKIPNIININEKLKILNGWEVIGVNGLIDDDVFFKLLGERKFPITTWIRKKNQIDYIEEPDMFHDLFGHVPFLANSKYTSFLIDLSKKAKPIFESNDKEAQYKMSRLYWYTIEFGLLKESDGNFKIYGSGIISSYNETNRSLSNVSKKVKYNTKKLSLRFEKDSLQDFYVYIEDNLQKLNTIKY